ncbi:MAG: hypothetical protein WCK57_11480 [Verrucomicrobiae bacterium]
MTSNNNRRIWRAGVAVAFAMLTVSLSAQSSAHPVEAAVKPGQPWRAYPTCTLADLPAAATNQIDPPVTSYGELAGQKVKATGFFHAAQLGDRWWLVDPEGGLFLNKAVVSVAPLLDSMKRINLCAYVLLSYFDGKSTSQTWLRPAEEKNH